LWIMRTFGLDEIGATRSQIGGIKSSETKTYESHYLQAFKGDIIYFFSDGILNQFGGSKDKKLTGKKFKAVLTSISGIQLSDQKIILRKFINEWKGNNAQVDDILVVGLKL
jgi:serine phosphatase RsbU (regulator of sigma subunit)